ncbi:hypothetical protein ES703_27149 [subsurface metagenome]
MLDDGGHLLAEVAGVSFSLEVESLRHGECLVEDGGGLALLGIEVGIPTAHRQSVRLTHRRQGNHFHFQVQVGDHFLDNYCLLGVLLPEVGFVGLHDVE